MYAFFDGDGIGSKIEILLIENKIEQAIAFSESLKTAMSMIQKELSKKPSIEVLIIGGDDLLIKKQGEFIKNELEIIRNIYKNNNTENATFSCGVGDTVEKSMNSLNKAKLYGKDQIFGLEVQKNE